MLKLREDLLLTVQDEHKLVCETMFETQYYWDSDDRTYNELPTKLVDVAREKHLETVLTQRHIHVVKHREYVTHEWSTQSATLVNRLLEWTVASVWWQSSKVVLSGITMGSRRGRGRAKHIDTAFHWVWDVVMFGTVKLLKNTRQTRHTCWRVNATSDRGSHGSNCKYKQWDWPTEMEKHELSHKTAWILHVRSEHKIEAQNWIEIVDSRIDARAKRMAAPRVARNQENICSLRRPPRVLTTRCCGSVIQGQED